MLAGITTDHQLRQPLHDHGVHPPAFTRRAAPPPAQVCRRHLLHAELHVDMPKKALRLTALLQAAMSPLQHRHARRVRGPQLPLPRADFGPKKSRIVRRALACGWLARSCWRCASTRSLSAITLWNVASLPLFNWPSMRLSRHPTCQQGAAYPEPTAWYICSRGSWLSMPQRHFLHVATPLLRGPSRVQYTGCALTPGVRLRGAACSPAALLDGTAVALASPRQPDPPLWAAPPPGGLRALSVAITGPSP